MGSVCCATQVGENWFQNTPATEEKATVQKKSEIEQEAKLNTSSRALQPEGLLYFI